MNLQDPEDRELAAAEYVTGTLAPADLAIVEAALATDDALRAAVYAWQDRLLDLNRRVPPVTPAAQLWDRIEAALPSRPAPAGTLPAARPAAANDPQIRRVRRWQIVSGLAMAASVVLATLLVVRAPPPAAEGARYLALLQGPDQRTGWVVEATSGQQVRLVPVGTTEAPPPGRVVQFWTKPDGAAGPTSLGLVPADRASVLPISKLPALGERQLFELTLEPEGGSPIGRPTGPVLFVGRTVRL